MSLRTGVRHVPLAAPVLHGRERDYVLDALERNELSWHGEYVGRFERDLAMYVGTDYALSSSSGTAALHLAMKALDVRPGDEVIVPALTYVATANAVAYCDALPTFADVDPLTWNISPDSVEDLLVAGPSAGRRIAGVIAVHLYGVPCDMTRLRNLCNEAGIFLVEDAAQALGARWLGLNIGGLSDIASFSFYANKIVTMGEGGAVTTDNIDLIERVRYYRGHCQDKSGHYTHSDVGFNYRLTNIQAAIGVAQLESLQAKLLTRRTIGDAYRSGFAGKLAWQRYYDDSQPVDWMFSVLLPDGVSRDHVAGQLRAGGIETRPIFTPLCDLPMYRTLDGCAAAREIARRGLNLPTHELLTVEDLDYVVENVLSAVGKKR
jgi:perosamine synthetase